MTREEWAAQLAARAADAERFGASAPLAVTLRAVLAELDAVDGMPVTPPVPDRLLTLDEAAERLRVPKRWLTEHRRELPFVKKLVQGGTVRVSERELARWMATR